MRVLLLVALLFGRANSQGAFTLACVQAQRPKDLQRVLPTSAAALGAQPVGVNVQTALPFVNATASQPGKWTTGE